MYYYTDSLPLSIMITAVLPRLITWEWKGWGKQKVMFFFWFVYTVERCNKAIVADVSSYAILMRFYIEVYSCWGCLMILLQTLTKILCCKKFHAAKKKLSFQWMGVVYSWRELMSTSLSYQASCRIFIFLYGAVRISHLLLKTWFSSYSSKLFPTFFGSRF